MFPVPLPYFSVLVRIYSSGMDGQKKGVSGLPQFPGLSPLAWGDNNFLVTTTSWLACWVMEATS